MRLQFRQAIMIWCASAALTARKIILWSQNARDAFRGVNLNLSYLSFLLLSPSSSSRFRAMSSTYAHYQGPSSLPSDYALLSHFAHRDHSAPHPRRVPENGAAPASGDEDEDEDTEPTPTQTPRRTVVTRRESFPASAYYTRPPRPTIGSYPRERRYDDAEPGSGNGNSASNDQSFPSLGLPDENTPLLSNPPVPRIEEPIDRDATADAGTPLEMFWEELVILAKYALPVFGTHLLEYSLVIVSVVSIGHISTTALAAISLGSMTASVSGFSVIQGFASALDTMLPSAWTSPQPHLVGLWSQRMTIVMFSCLIPTLFIWWNAEAILVFLKQEPEVAHLASIYLRWVSFGLPAYAFNCISRRYFQSQGLFAVPTRIVFIVAPTNALLNYLLVWGPPSIRLGFIGAPIATAISFNLIALLSIAYGVLYTPPTAWSPISLTRDSLKKIFSLKALSVLTQLGLSGVGQTASEWWAWELVALAASLLGPVALATQSVLLVSSSTTFQAPFALGVATSVRIGNLLGEQKARRAGVAANTSLVMAFGIAFFTSTLFLVFRDKWAYLFNDDPAVVTLVADIMPLLALFQVFDGTSAVTGGILRARGKQFFGALLNLSAYYTFGIPLGIYLAFTHKMGLHGLWIGLTVSLVYCSAVGTWVSVRTDWNKEVDKVRKRVREEEVQEGRKGRDEESDRRV
ncbi:unnamed protein product [Cyclocybe aegerita]|uniref:MATE efflux family protein n=1 Tax=Cyclocybe aegerita TaxID=1973307 RepID=A0A8S0W3B7_CYCAE|nr:unnamed protein product [Cyclocybe aegerita]